MATETKTSIVKLKSNDPDESSNGKKKIANSSKVPTDSKMKSEVKSKTTSSSSNTTSKTTTTKVREKKVYSLPGQKHDPPEEKEPLRIFYESLSKQIPTSEMAEFWLMEHGMLSPEKAKKAFEKKQKKKQKELRAGNSVEPSTIAETSNKQESKNGDIKAKKIVVENDDGDDDDDDDDNVLLSSKRRKR